MLNKKNHCTLKELPNCHGPKLHRFRYWNAPIEWGEQLDKIRATEPHSDGHVFRVKIRSQFYAIKVFRYFNPETTRWYWEPYLGESFPVDTVAYHTDPFYAECRAYGRVNDNKKKGSVTREIVVPCHGFLFLKDKDKALLRERGVDFAEEQLDHALARRTVGTYQVRAIVKSLASRESGVSLDRLGGILRDIRLLNKLKVYNRDIRIENFKDGRLVDFGSSLTEPNCLLEAFDLKDKEEARDTRLQDLVLFDNMVEEQEIATSVRAMPNVEYCQKLRSWATS